MEAARVAVGAEDERPRLEAVDGRRRKPTRVELERAATSLIERRGTEVLRHARRFSRSDDDAEDAFQRGLEILLTKAPSTDDDVLVPWLKTVVMREAFAINKRALRSGIPIEVAVETATTGHGPEEHVERYEQLRIGAEAMSRLKPHEIQAMLLRAEGHSYSDIQAATGWTHTKVNRCLTEGRRAFLGHVEGIENGADCARLEPLMSAFADGEAAAGDVLTLRRHLRSCPGCRATLRRYRSAPRELAAIAGPVGMAATSTSGSGHRILEQAQYWIGDRFALVSMKIQGAAEMSGAGKLLAVAASSAALAGGGAAITADADKGHDSREQRSERAAAPAESPIVESARAVESPIPAVAVPRPRPDDGDEGSEDQAKQPDTEGGEEQAAPAEETTDSMSSAGEFDPSVGPASESDGSGPSGGDSEGGSSGGGSASGGSRSGGGGDSGGEFAP